MSFLALVVIGYTLLRNVYPYPTDAGAWYPIIAALWVIVGVLLTFVRSDAPRRGETDGRGGSCSRWRFPDAGLGAR